MNSISDMVIFLLLGYAILNLIALSVFLIDKVKAKKNKWRISEKTLLIVAALGPFGATVGMVKFRHKTRKLKFKLVYVALAIHILLIIAILYFLL